MVYEAAEVNLSCKALGDTSFDSNFESGNLEYVVSEDLATFELYLRPDSNTHGHFQWFYFTVHSRTVQTITLVIKNFIKAKMMYRNGLRPYYRSNLSGNTAWTQL